ncbi:hypothetical protein AVEN_137759-1 [Araneus ventricosus]|uniref:Tc1-like transposase DDE domain-containing protein n=1 Tax=Araneus ventricosus TaxID=182803 RepID=A0A4Y2CF36_ARAVE|nr:hypothetical protein AVEN_137759-1 [Araneus ventricosus]
MMGHLQVSACELFNKPSLIWALRAELTARHKALLLSWARQHWASVMVWDVCSCRDMGPLIRLETTLTGDRYLSILPDHLYSFMSIVNSDGLGQFQQDNATPHASGVAPKWLQEHSSDFRHFHWPPKSPDINIIEYIWHALLHVVEKRSPSHRTSMVLLISLRGVNFLQDTFRH